jgi:hypothetical protein
MPTQPGERHEGDCTGQKGGGVDGMVVLIHFRDKTSTIVEKPQEKNARPCFRKNTRHTKSMV